MLCIVFVIVAAIATAENRCGTDWNHANANCDNTPCEGTNDPCPDGQQCYTDLNTCAVTEPTPSSPSPPTSHCNIRTHAPTTTLTPAPAPPTDGPSCTLNTYMGYYASWAATRACNSMSPNDIDPTPYSHLVFSFAKLSSTYELVPFHDTDEPLYAPFNALKTQKPNLKTVIAVGGWTHNDPDTPTEFLFSQAASTDENRKAFANSCVTFLRKHNFDGVDIDWEYPGDTERGGTKADKENFPLLLREIRAAFNASQESFELSVAIPLGAWRLEAGYALTEIQPYVDHINIMSYDLHGPWELGSAPYVNAHANLTEIDAELNQFDILDSQKLNLGLAAYGLTMRLASTSCAEPGCTFTGTGTAGKCTQTSGILSIAEIVDLKITPTVKTGEAAYGTYNGDSWVSFDTTETLQEKVEIAKTRCYGGLLAWSIDQDSLTSPLLSTVKLT